MGWTVRGSIPGKSKMYFSSLSTSRPTDIGVYPASYSIGIFLYRGKGARHDVDNSPRLALRLKMSTSVPLLLVYDFMALSLPIFV